MSHPESEFFRNPSPEDVAFGRGVDLKNQHHLEPVGDQGIVAENRVESLSQDEVDRKVGFSRVACNFLIHKFFQKNLAHRTYSDDEVVRDVVGEINEFSVSSFGSINNLGQLAEQSIRNSILAVFFVHIGKDAAQQIQKSGEIFGKSDIEINAGRETDVLKYNTPEKTAHIEKAICHAFSAVAFYEIGQDPSIEFDNSLKLAGNIGQHAFYHDGRQTEVFKLIQDCAAYVGDRTVVENAAKLFAEKSKIQYLGEEGEAKSEKEKKSDFIRSLVSGQYDYFLGALIRGVGEETLRKELASFFNEISVRVIKYARGEGEEGELKEKGVFTYLRQKDVLHFKPHDSENKFASLLLFESLLSGKLSIDEDNFLTYYNNLEPLLPRHRRVSLYDFSQGYHIFAYGLSKKLNEQGKSFLHIWNFFKDKKVYVPNTVWRLFYDLFEKCGDEQNMDFCVNKIRQFSVLPIDAISAMTFFADRGLTVEQYQQLFPLQKDLLSDLAPYDE